MTGDWWDTFLSAIFSGLCMVLTWFFGEFNGAAKVLLAFIVVDYVFGVTAAYMNGELNSKTGFKGIAKKVMILSLVGVAHICGKELLGDSTAPRDMVIYFYIANEGVSIIENADKTHVKIPEGLKKVFKKIGGGKKLDKNT